MLVIIFYSNEKITNKFTQKQKQIKLVKLYIIYIYIYS